MSAARERVAPPGYRDLDDIMKQNGRDHAQTKLMSGQWPAFKLNLVTGDLEPIPVTTWCALLGLSWLEHGASERSGPGPLGRPISYTVIVRVSEQPPPLLDDPKDASGPMVRLAKELMDAAFPQGEWHQMKVKAVRKGCEPEAEARQVQLPSADSFSRAMGRRPK